MLKVLIRRKFKPGKEQEIRALLNQMRSDAVNMEGYISGETYFGHDDPNQMLVISTWQNLENWRSWKESDIRTTNATTMMEMYQEGPTTYEEYVLPKIKR